MLVFYLLLGLATDLAIEKISVKTEIWLGENFIGKMDTLDNQPLQKNLQKLVAHLPAESPLHEYDFHVHLVASDEINALAMPGGHIIVFTGLVEKAESENELAMVLAHELGHYANRDHLRRLGRGLGLTFASILLFGENSSVSDLGSKFLLLGESHYSRQQEAAADRFGLDLLVDSYGHAGGATDFFIRISKKPGRTASLLASHPHPQARIEEIEELIAENHYPVKETIPVDDELLDALSEQAEAGNSEQASPGNE